MPPLALVLVVLSASLASCRQCTQVDLRVTEPYKANCSLALQTLNETNKCLVAECRLYYRSFVLVDCTDTDGSNVTDVFATCIKDAPKLLMPKENPLSTAPPVEPTAATPQCAPNAVAPWLNQTTTIPTRCSVKSTNGDSTFDPWTLKSVDCKDIDCLDVLNLLRVQSLANPARDCSVKMNSSTQPRWFLGNLVALCSMAITAPPTPKAKAVVVGSNTATVVGVSLGGVVALVLVCCLVWRRRRWARSEDYAGMSSPSTKGQGTTTGGTSSANSSTALTSVNLGDLVMHRVTFDNVHLQHLVAQGAYGQVWQAEYNAQTIAVKKLPTHVPTQQALEQFVAEIALHAKIQTPDNQRIVKFIGAAWPKGGPGDMMLLLEYMDQGDLREMLQHNATTHQLAWIDKLHVALQVAEALVFLHSLYPPVVHRDLKSRNILLDSKSGAKITDFGVSRELDDATMTAGIGTYRWMAPEVLYDGHYTELADVFSFGVILAELETEILPYSDLRDPTTGEPYTDTSIITKVIAGTLQPSLKHDVPSWYATLVRDCLARDPDDRPNAMKVHHRLRLEMKSYDEGGLV
ncbi:Aste57867_12333 [Aphanomyces stellatus]|uniref:Aste57867_12333 protein n=1 Tax=Aphanomyces stellatus TaxID=120398 RepID=A0A485KVR4_9STRA|nr:hypothetical protein As57867_012287 [Aphanomyces stellatus]VFT89185.1 Aste57867_12333 [Aphanomyces stellatus]